MPCLPFLSADLLFTSTFCGSFPSTDVYTWSCSCASMVNRFSEVQHGQVLCRQHSLSQPNLGQDRATSASQRPVILVKHAQKALPHLAGLLARINLPPNPRLLVVSHHRTRLAVICAQSCRQRLLVVVAALNQWLASDIVGHRFLGWVEDLVVAAAGGGVDETAGDAGDEEGVVDLELDGVHEGFRLGFEHLVEALCLGDCAWETVEDEAEVA